MTSEFNLTSVDDLPMLVSHIHDHFESSTKPLKIKVQNKRSLDANAQVHVWIPQIANWMGESVDYVRKLTKMQQGLPIILADSEYGDKTRFVLDKCGFESLTMDQQLGLVDFLPVTRLFSTKQHNAFRDSIQVHYEHQGLTLEYQNK